MKRFRCTSVLISLCSACILLITFAYCDTTNAADKKLRLSIEDALSNPKIKSRLKDIPLYWGKGKHPQVRQDFGRYKTTKRTNAFLKSKVKACQWALLSAILSLQDRALKEGGNAVIDICSNVKDQEYCSSTEYECLVGGLMVNVALKGSVVQLK